MNPSFVAYIDESGDEGFNFERGSSDWLVLAGIVVRKMEDLNTVKLVERVRGRLSKLPKSPLHFRDLRHEQKLVYLDEISRAPLCAICVLVYKRLMRQNIFQQEFRLYFYAARFLIERISWYCRDSRSPSDFGDGSVEIVFSNPSGMSYEELRRYIDTLKGLNKSRQY